MTDTRPETAQPTHTNPAETPAHETPEQAQRRREATVARRRLLPMAGHVSGKRSPVTCALKCGNACTGEICNKSDNGYFKDIAEAALTRRKALGLGAAGAIVAAAVTAQPAAADARTNVGARAAKLLPFTPIQPVDATVDALDVPKGYTWSPIIRWGDRLFSTTPVFDFNNQEPWHQKNQFGYNNDYLDILVDESGTSAALVCNHEYVNPDIMFDTTTPDQVHQAKYRAIARAAHGMAVVELTRSKPGTPWTYVIDGKRNRRIHTETPFKFTGPAAGSDLLKTSQFPSGHDTHGTIGNCAGGTTPWGTILSGEENFNGYFRAEAKDPREKRFGLKNEPSKYGWEADEERWDARNPGQKNAPNQFGWIVEMDPQDPTSTPVKHTALGRFKHEGANIHVAPDGRVAAYMGDDERFDYLYKFVSKNKVSRSRKANMKLLSEGDLYVAKFRGNSEDEIDGSGRVPSDGAFDGAGTWLPLVVNGRSMIKGMSVAEVCVYTRLAADKAGATKMDRCEDVEPSHKTGKVYVACTKNDRRGIDGNAPADEANPRSVNRDGHIVEITESRDDATSTTFNWNLLLVCGDPAQIDNTYFSGFDESKVSPISCPDNLAFDSTGNLWISTDGAPSAMGYNDGLFKVTLDGNSRGRVEQFLSVPTEAETCGPVIHDRDGMVYVAVQHPGEDGTYHAQNSWFPDYTPPGTVKRQDQAHAPRPSVVQVHKK